jgi:hypothetical protein
MTVMIYFSSGWSGFIPDHTYQLQLTEVSLHKFPYRKENSDEIILSKQKTLKSSNIILTEGLKESSSLQSLSLPSSASSHKKNHSNKKTYSSTSVAARRKKKSNDQVNQLPVITNRGDNITPKKCMVVNESYSIRSDDDRFGRYFTTLRKSMTQDDKIPFPTR